MKKLVLGMILLLFVSSVAKALVMNPDGYIGSLTAVLDATYQPLQTWNTQNYIYEQSRSNMWNDLSDQNYFNQRQWGYSFDLLFKYPVSRCVTFGFGGSYTQQYLHTKRDFQEVSWPTLPGGLSNTWNGATDYDDNHAIYTFKAHLVYYWGSPNQ